MESPQLAVREGRVGEPRHLCRDVVHDQLVEDEAFKQFSRRQSGESMRKCRFRFRHCRHVFGGSLARLAESRADVNLGDLVKLAAELVQLRLHRDHLVVRLGIVVLDG
mgnify:CR=1 FL=1